MTFYYVNFWIDVLDHFLDRAANVFGSLLKIVRYMFLDRCLDRAAYFFGSLFGSRAFAGVTEFWIGFWIAHSKLQCWRAIWPGWLTPISWPIVCS